MGNTQNRGFASMDDQKQREIASKGGKAAHQLGTAHQFTPTEAREAGRKGGQAVSRNREHMAFIGRLGGEASRAGRKAAARRERNETAAQDIMNLVPETPLTLSADTNSDGIRNGDQGTLI